MALIDTDPELVKAGFDALKSVEPGEKGAYINTFIHKGQEYWIKVTIDYHANTFDEAWLFHANDPRVGHV